MWYFRYTVPEKDAKPLIQAVDTACQSAAASLVQLHNNLCDMEAKNAKVLISRGAVPQTMQTRLEEKQKQCVPCCTSLCQTPASRAV